MTCVFLCFFKKKTAKQFHDFSVLWLENSDCSPKGHGYIMTPDIPDISKYLGAWHNVDIKTE